MSIACRTWVAVCSPTKGAARHVLDQLADHADENGVAWPSQATLAELTGYTERGVRGLLVKLVEAGVLTVEHNYVRQYRKPGAHTVAYRLVVTLCRHNGEPDRGQSWARHCTHGGRNVVPPRRRRTPSEGGNEVPPQGRNVMPGQGRNDVPGTRNEVPQTPERRAGEPPLEPPLNDGSPSQVTVTSARDDAPLRSLGPDDVACASCSTHHPRGQHLPPTPAPSDWRSRAVSDTASDDPEPDDDLPWDPYLDEQQETFG